MRSIRLWPVLRVMVFSTAAFLLLSMTAMHALAQTPGSLPTPGSGPTLSLATAVVTVLSVLLGILTQMIQTGRFLGQWVTPKAWLPEFTLGATFLGGVVAYLTSQAPLTLNGATIFYAVMAGVVDLVSGAAPGIAVHAHIIVPAKLRALRAASVVAKPTAPPAPPSAPTVAQQGFVRAGIVGMLALVGVMVLVLGPGVVRSTSTVDVSPAAEIAVVSSVDNESTAPMGTMIAIEGCGWFNSSGGVQTTTSSEQVAQCVFEQILQGVNDPGTIATACFNVTGAAVLAVIDSILNFYTQAVDGGVGGMLCGTGAPPVVGANACITATQVANAKAMRSSVAAKLQTAH